MAVDDNYDLGPILEPTGGTSEVRWDDLRFPAQAIGRSGAASDPDPDTSTGLYLFDGSSTESLFGVAQMPHSWLEESTVIPHVHWQKTVSESPTGNVLWQLDYEVVNNGDVAAMDYGTQLQTSSVVAGTPDDGTPERMLISSFGNVSMRDKRISCIIYWKLSRIGGDAADSHTSDIRLVEFDFHYICDGRGSAEQYSKLDWGK